MTAEMEAPCDKTGGPCDWVPDWDDNDQYCTECYRSRRWEKSEYVSTIILGSVFLDGESSKNTLTAAQNPLPHDDGEGKL